MGKVFLIDPTKCNGCRNCQLACKDEHVDNDWSPYAKPQPDTGQFWTELVEEVHGQVPKVKISYTIHMCQHCDDAPCMKAAPEAVYKRDDGLVIVDPEKAKGMKHLVDACPYGSIFYNEALDIPQKCTGCAHLVDAGEIPHCVDVCPHEAIRFVDEEEVAEELKRSELLMPERASDKPRVHYFNLPKRFIGGIVVDLEADEVVIGAKVTLENTESGEVIVTETDEFGDFWFHQIEAASYQVYVEAEGYLTRFLPTSTIEEDKNIGAINLFVAETI